MQIHVRILQHGSALCHEHPIRWQDQLVIIAWVVDQNRLKSSPLGKLANDGRQI